MYVKFKFFVLYSVHGIQFVDVSITHLSNLELKNISIRAQANIKLLAIPLQSNSSYQFKFMLDFKQAPH